MEKFYKFYKKNYSKFKIFLKIIIFLLLIIFCFLIIFKFLTATDKKPKLFFQSSNDSLTKDSVSLPVVETNTSSTVLLTEDSQEDTQKGTPKDTQEEIKRLYPTKKNGRVWSDTWSNNQERTLTSGKRDPFDKEFVVRGNGTVFINGQGVAYLEGDAPRMYVFDASKIKKWTNVEVTIYSRRISETEAISSQGIVLGARSEHQDATKENPCLGATYYGRLLYDGRAVFQKEVIHGGLYSVNKPGEKNMAVWNTEDGTLPRNIWIGVKFIVKNNLDGQSVKLELYRDLTDGYRGGTWEKVAEYIDNGNWAQVDSEVDVASICGYSADKILSEAGTSVFVRNDKIESTEYKWFSVREIE
ncbi:MAG TPA: hypothetical protein PLK76_00600 [bacterium]|nr:hypothetical protein [bacterium]